MARRFEVPIILATAVLVAGGCGSRATDAPRRDADGRPNVVWITVDALRADHVTLGDGLYDLTPRLAELADESLVFTQAVSSFVGTTASMPSLMTGLYPSFEGIPDWNPDTWNGFADLKTPDEAGEKGLTETVRTIAEILRDAGYRTAGFNTNPFLGPPYGFNQGFDSYEQFLPYLAQARRTRTHELEPSYPPAPEVGAKVAAWLEDNTRRPFFLWLHLMDPHSPYLPPEPFDRQFLPAPTAASDLDVNRALYHLLFAARGQKALADPLPSFGDLGLSRDAFARHAKGLYRGEVGYADRSIGTLVDRLRALDLLDSSVLVVTADHGEEFFEHGHIFHELSQPGYEEVIRIPLLIRLPGAAPTATRVDDVVRMVDVAPTTLEAIGLGSEADHMDGRSLLALVRGEAEPERAAFISAPDFGIARTATWKYRLHPRGAGREALYRIADDPLEREDLADVEPERLADMRALWASHASQLRNRARRNYDGQAGVPEIDAETRRRLEVLGYTQ